ncbi:hypothetical protein [Brachybacterium hainanense]|uniref:Adhesin domain-containing protein n=1 Tax=Brachybacterium hainanense TaxID=1541174 RepID=A0ABV6RAU0_9MICO
MTTTIPPHVLSPSPRGERSWRVTLTLLAGLVVLAVLALLGAQTFLSWWTQGSYQQAPAQVELTGATSVSLRSDVGDIVVIPGDVTSPTLGLVEYGSTQLPGEDATALARVTVSGTAESPTVTVQQPAMNGPIPWEDDHRSLLLVVPQTGLRVTDAYTSVGDVSITATGPQVTARTDTGDVHVQDVPADATVSATSNVGDVDVQIGAAGPASSIEAVSDVGDVSVLVPAGSRWAVDASTSTGELWIAPGIESSGAGDPVLRIRTSVGSASVTR